MADLLTIAVINCLVGFEVFVLGFQTTFSSRNSVEALLIIAFLLYIVSVIMVILMKIGELQGNMIAKIVTIIFLIVAGIFIFAGMGKCEDDNDNNGNGVSCTSYSTCQDVCGGTLGIIAAILLIVGLVQRGGGKSTGPAA